MDDEDGIARVVAAIRDNAASRSPLYRYLWKHRKTFARAMGSRRVDWAGVATALTKLELRDAAGQLASASSVQKTWARVRRDDGAARGRAPRRRVPTLAAASGEGEVAPGVRPVATPPAPGPDNVPQRDETAHASQAPVLPRPPAVFAAAAQSASTASAQSSQSPPDATGGMTPSIGRAEDPFSRLRAEIEGAQPQMPAVVGKRFRKS